MKSSNASDWTWTTLEGVARQSRNAIADGPFGSNLKLTDYTSSGVPVLQGKNITDDRFQWRDVRFITEAKADELQRSVVREGDVLIVKIGSIGYSAILDNLNGYDRAVIPANLAKISIDPAVVDIRFLSRWLTTDEVKRQLRESASKTAQPALSLGKLKALKVPLPPLLEQRRIAAILDQADGLRAKRRQILTRLDGLDQAIFYDMFGGLVRDRELGGACKRVTDGTHQSPGWESQGVPFLFVSNITSGEINTKTKKFISADTWANLTRRTPIEIGDVLYSTVGSYGIPAVVRTNERFAFQRHIAHIKRDPDQLNADFLSAQLASTPLKRQAHRAARGIAQPTVNLADIKKFKLAIPPMPEQECFAGRTAALRSQRARLHRAITRDDELFRSLQSRAFRGEL